MFRELEWGPMRSSNARKIFIILTNVIIMSAILTFVVFYSKYKNRDSYEQQVEHFVDTTLTMEQVTENYMTGEQRICDVWARYINNENMTMEEAANYIRASHVVPTASAHLVSLDTLEGLSTRPRLGTTDGYTVSYKRINLLDDVDWIDDVGESINIDIRIYLFIAFIYGSIYGWLIFYQVISGNTDNICPAYTRSKRNSVSAIASRQESVLTFFCMLRCFHYKERTRFSKPKHRRRNVSVRSPLKTL